MCDKDEIVLGLVSVVNGIDEKELKKDLINKICQPFAQKILEDSKLIPGQEAEEETGTAKKLSLSRVMKNLEKLSLIVKNLTPVEDTSEDHVIVSILQDMWALLHSFLRRFYVEAPDPRTWNG